VKTQHEANRFVAKRLRTTAKEQGVPPDLPEVLAVEKWLALDSEKETRIEEGEKCLQEATPSARVGNSGGTTAAIVGDDFQVKEFPFHNVEELKRHYEGAYVGSDPDFCVLAAMAGASFSSTMPAEYSTPMEGAAALPLVFPDEESIRKGCLDVDADADFDRPGPPRGSCEATMR
jgi:hypothetical protein